MLKTALFDCAVNEKCCTVFLKFGVRREQKTGFVLAAVSLRLRKIGPKNRTLKCLKRHYLTVRSMKNVAVLTEDGAFALFFRPHPGGFDSSRVPTPGNLPSKAKKMLMPGGQPRGGAGRRGN